MRLVGKAIIYYIIRLLTRITISELRLELILVLTVIRKAVCTESDSAGCIVKPTFRFILFMVKERFQLVLSAVRQSSHLLLHSLFSTFYQIQNEFYILLDKRPQNHSTQKMLPETLKYCELFSLVVKRPCRVLRDMCCKKFLIFHDLR